MLLTRTRRNPPQYEFPGPGAKSQARGCHNSTDWPGQILVWSQSQVRDQAAAQLDSARRRRGPASPRRPGSGWPWRPSLSAAAAQPAAA